MSPTVFELKTIAQGRHFIFVYFQLEGNAKVNVWGLFLWSIQDLLITEVPWLCASMANAVEKQQLPAACLKCTVAHRTRVFYCLAKNKNKTRQMHKM